MGGLVDKMGRLMDRWMSGERVSKTTVTQYVEQVTLFLSGAWHQLNLICSINGCSIDLLSALVSATTSLYVSLGVFVRLFVSYLERDFISL